MSLLDEKLFGKEGVVAAEGEPERCKTLREVINSPRFDKILGQVLRTDGQKEVDQTLQLIKQALTTSTGKITPEQQAALKVFCTIESNKTLTHLIGRKGIEHDLIDGNLSRDGSGNASIIHKSLHNHANSLLLDSAANISPQGYCPYVESVSKEGNKIFIIGPHQFEGTEVIPLPGTSILKVTSKKGYYLVGKDGKSEGIFNIGSMIDVSPPKRSGDTEICLMTLWEGGNFVNYLVNTDGKILSKKYTGKIEETEDGTWWCKKGRFFGSERLMYNNI